MLERVFQSELIHDSLVYVGGSVLYRAASFVLVPLYLRYLSPEEYGVWAMLLSIITVIGVLLDMGLNSAVVRYYYEYLRQPDRASGYLIVNFLFRILAGVGVLGLFSVFGVPLWRLATGGAIPFSPYAVVVIGVVYCESLIALVTSVYRAQRRAVQFVVAKLVKTVVEIASSVLLVVTLEQGALGPLCGRLLAASVVGAFLSVTFLWEHKTLRLRWSDLRKSLSFGIPLVPHNLAAWMRNSADRVILVQFVSLEALGHYNLAATAGVAMSVLVTSIDLAYSPYYYKLMETRHDAREMVRSLGSLYVSGMGAVCLIGSLFANEILHIMAPPSYSEAIKMIPLVLVAYFLHGQYTQCVKPLFFNKMTKTIPWLTGVPGLIGIGLIFALAPIWGVWAALWGVFSAEVLTLIAVYIVSDRVDSIGFPLARILVVNGLVMMGVLLASYVFPAKAMPSVILGKCCYLGAYCLVALLLAWPHLHRLGVAIPYKRAVISESDSML